MHSPHVPLSWASSGESLAAVFAHQRLWHLGLAIPLLSRSSTGRQWWWFQLVLVETEAIHIEHGGILVRLPSAKVKSIWWPHFNVHSSFTVATDSWYATRHIQHFTVGMPCSVHFSNKAFYKYQITHSQEFFIPTCARTINIDTTMQQLSHSSGPTLPLFTSWIDVPREIV